MLNLYYFIDKIRFLIFYLRFPTMESNSDGRNGKLDVLYYGKTNLIRNSSLPKNLNSVKNENSNGFQGLFNFK